MNPILIPILALILNPVQEPGDPVPNTIEEMTMARSSAVPRTLKLLRDEGYSPWVVESYNAFSGKRNDMYGFADIIAIDDEQTLAVQVCGADFSSHVHKMTEEAAPAVTAWLKGRDRKALLVGWRKVKARRGGKLMIFRPRIIEFRLDGGLLSMREYKNDESISQILSLNWD